MYLADCSNHYTARTLKLTRIYCSEGLLFLDDMGVHTIADITYDAVADNKNVYLNDLREDFSVPSFPTEKILQNAVNDENCFVVPKVVE